MDKHAALNKLAAGIMTPEEQRKFGWDFWFNHDKAMTRLNEHNQALANAVNNAVNKAIDKEVEKRVNGRDSNYAAWGLGGAAGGGLLGAYMGGPKHRFAGGLTGAILGGGAGALAHWLDRMARQGAFSGGSDEFSIV